MSWLRRLLHRSPAIASHPTPEQMAVLEREGTYIAVNPARELVAYAGTWPGLRENPVFDRERDLVYRRSSGTWERLWMAYDIDDQGRHRHVYMKP